MTFWLLIIATLVVAVADWFAVASDRRDAEYVLKPLTMIVLIAATAVMPSPIDETARTLVVAGLVFSLIGDVCLMLGEKLFLGGLVAFLVAHVAYVAGFAQLELSIPLLVAGLVVVLIAAATIGTRIVRGANASDPRLAVPVAAYMAVISAMVVVAFGTGRPVAILGALLFYVSDACIGWTRFVQDFRRGRIAVMTTYHLGQIGLVLALVS